MESTIDLIHNNQFRDYFKMMNNDDGLYELVLQDFSMKNPSEKSQLSLCSLDVLKEERGERDLSKLEKTNKGRDFCEILRKACSDAGTSIAGLLGNNT